MSVTCYVILMLMFLFAETSVTIEDVVFVIDTCRVKENSYDDVSNILCLHIYIFSSIWPCYCNVVLTVLDFYFRRVK